MKHWFCVFLFFLYCTNSFCQASGNRPNILFCISDDQSFPHASAYGTEWVNTPAFDRVASEGILFMNAYTPNAKCAPSRSCIITGRNSWQLEEAANHVPFFPAKFKTYVEALSDAGYHTGYTGKGWAPGNPGMKNNRKRELIGPVFNEQKTIPPARFISEVDYSANFEAFLESNRSDAPFCFWYGGMEPHRRYQFQAGITQGGKNLQMIEKVFDFWPDNDTVRTDMLDYAFEIEYFDQHLIRMLQILEDRGELDNTIVIVTSDNGMPFPRVKGQTYEYSHHLPLAIMWKNGIADPGRKYEALVSFTDFAPTFLEIAGVEAEKSGILPMEGTSLVPVFENRSDPHRRDFMVIGKERHDLGRPDDTGYPVRGIIRGDFLYLTNFKSDRWPSGNPETGYMNTDGSPTKTFILHENRNQGPTQYWTWSFGRKGEEELYNISQDPDCIFNLVDQDDWHRKLKEDMRNLMGAELRREGDPRVLGNGDVFDQYPYAQDNKDFYNRFMAGEKLKAGWINQSDIETKPVPEKP